MKNFFLIALLLTPFYSLSQGGENNVCADQPEGSTFLSFWTDTIVTPVLSDPGDTLGFYGDTLTYDTLIVIEEVIETCGCTDSNATNYYPQSTLDNGLCQYANDCANQPEGSTFLSFWTDTIITPVVVEGDTLIYDTLIVTEVATETCGCTDSSATNYYAESTADNGLCEYASECANQPEGTVISLAVGGDTIVVQEIVEGDTLIYDTLIVPIFVTEICGCTDSSATNYYPQSTLDNGLCEYANDCANQPEGSTFLSFWTDTIVTPVVVEGDTLIYDTLIVTEVVTETCGCADSSATNYYPQSTLDNGLCEYASECADQPEGTEISLTVVTDTLVSTWVAIDSISIAINDSTVIYVLDSIVNYDTLIVSDVVTEICGCTDSSATNYYPQSTLDNGLCEYSIGCINPGACNYDPGAVESDGSCLFPGDPCDDNDATTTNDMFNDACECQGDEPSQVVEEVLDMALYPNPVRDWLNVQLENGMAASLILFDPSGRIVQTWNTVGSIRLDLRHLPSGQYVMSIRPQIGPIRSERISLLDWN